jgi:hypothetical protein
MSGESDPFDEVRREPDLLARGRRATELLTLYQQRSAELARLRREAIDAAHRDLGMSFTRIAEAMGVTKGRITQIRGSAPARERAFFGVGPVSIGIPLRYGVTDRQRPLIAAEDVKTGEEIARLLGGYGLAVSRVHAIGSRRWRRRCNEAGARGASSRGPGRRDRGCRGRVNQGTAARQPGSHGTLARSPAACTARLARTRRRGSRRGSRWPHARRP